MAGVKGRSGMKPGMTNGGSFVKGDPRINREGAFVRKKLSFNQLINQHTQKAVHTLVECMDSEDSSWKDKKEAAELLLAHSQGKPVDRVVHADLTHGGAGADVSTLSLDQLKQLALNQLQDAEPDCLEGEVLVIEEEGPPEGV